MPALLNAQAQPRLSAEQQPLRRALEYAMKARAIRHVEAHATGRKIAPECGVDEELVVSAGVSEAPQEVFDVAPQP